MSQYRCRIPAISLFWMEVEADSKSDAIRKLAEKADSKTVDYFDENVWEVVEIQLCIICKKNPPFEHNGKVYKLCANCGWDRLSELLFMPQTVEEAHKIIEEVGIDIQAFHEKVKKVIGIYYESCGLCRGWGIIGKLEDQNKCPICKGTGKLHREE